MVEGFRRTNGCPWTCDARFCSAARPDENCSKLEKICTTRISQKGRKCTKTRINQRSRQKKRKSGKTNKIENKTSGTKTLHQPAKRQRKSMPFQNGEHQRNNSQATCKTDNSWLC